MWWLRTVSCLLARQQEASVLCVHLPVGGTGVQAVDQDDGRNVLLGATLATGSNSDASDPQVYHRLTSVSQARV